MAGGEAAFIGIRAAGEVVGGALSREGFVAEGFKVLTGLRGGTKEDLAAFIEHENLVELLVYALAGLVPNAPKRVRKSNA